MNFLHLFCRLPFTRTFESSRRRRLIIGILLFILLVGFDVSQVIGSVQSGPDRLQVVHVDAEQFAPKGSHPKVRWMTSDTLVVQFLYKMAYLQPHMAKGLWDCPADNEGRIYHLDFYKGTQLIQEMRLDLEGCRTLALSKTDGRFFTNSFLWLLSHALNMDTLVLPY